MVQENSVKGKLVIILGPTASGKTELSLEVAKRLNGEIVSADSMLIYKGLDVGTAKPTSEEMSVYPHHMIDIISPTDSYTVFDYSKKAKEIVDDILCRGKTPIICGGTGFYIKSIIYNLSYGNNADTSEIREQYKRLIEEKGKEYVFDILKEKDPQSAEKLHYNDVKRVIRALEICDSGTVKSSLNDSLAPVYDFDAYTFDFDREELYQRINLRVDRMFQNGLLSEVQSLLDSGIDNSFQCMQGIGYKEVYSYIKGELSFDEMVELLKKNTRNYAKRQITFFKKFENLTHLDPKINLSKNVDLIVSKYYEKEY